MHEFGEISNYVPDLSEEEIARAAATLAWAKEVQARARAAEEEEEGDPPIPYDESRSGVCGDNF